MIHKPVPVLVVVLALLISACGSGGNNPSAATRTPEFFTATLPVTPTPNPTDTPLPPTPVPTIPPIEGTTTTQVNVRAQPSTTSAALGLIPQSAKVQVAGKDASGTWYQLLYPESPQGKGWVLAAYVQVNAGAEIPVISVGSVSGVAASVLVIQQVNVRNGPGTSFESLGTLNPNDVAALTGKDSSGAWLEIEYASAPNGRGWVNAGFVQAAGAEALPVVGGTAQTAGIETPTDVLATAIPALAPAMDNGDSASAPAISVTFSPAGARALQYSGRVSAPQGDGEDWVQFTSNGRQIEVHVACSESKALKVELWKNGASLPGNDLACGERRVLVVESSQTYLLHVMATSQGDLSVTRYILKVKQITE